MTERQRLEHTGTKRTNRRGARQGGKRLPWQRRPAARLEWLERREMLDATAYTASMLVEANPAGDAIPVNEVSVGSKLFFFTTADSNFTNSSTASPDPASLWITDGTTAGTQQLTTNLTLVPPDLDFNATPTQFDANGNLLFFASTFGETGAAAYPQLWTSDGTAGGTHTLGDIQGTGPGMSVGPAAVLGNELYFLLYDGFTQATLWESDGTAAGTRAVNDPASGQPIAVYNNNGDAVPASDLIELGDTLYVVTSDGRLLSVANGAATASLVKDFGEAAGATGQTVDGKIVLDVSGPSSIAGTSSAAVLSAQPLRLAEDVYVSGLGTISVAAAKGVLANDTGPSQLTVTSGRVTGAEGGTFAFNADGSFTYTPPTNFPGFDYAKYTAKDSAGVQAAATVNVLSQTGGVVWKFYQQVLGRDPDYAGLQGWIDDFLKGGKAGDIAAGFFESTELLNQIITGYYQQYLGRAPRGDDLDFWGRAWRETGGPEGIKAEFADSTEFNAVAGNADGTNPGGWITALYQRILNRSPQGDDLPFWEKKLTSGVSEYNVALDFFTSLEADQNDVTGWFNEYLGRAPTTDEQAFFAKQMLGGATDRQIEQEITNSPEYGGSPTASSPGEGVPLPNYLSKSGSAKQTAALRATDMLFSSLGD